MEQNIAKSGAVNSSYVPPKMWMDLTDAERVVRLREEVKNRDWRINDMYNRLQQIEQLVKNHNHLDSGDVVQKVNGFGSGLGGLTTGNSSLKSASVNPDDVYF